MKWFSAKGINEEIKKVNWPTPKDMAKDFSTVTIFVLAFVAVFSIYYVVIYEFLKVIGVF